MSMDVSEYPEHDKVRAVKDQSEAIGAFLDLGLPSMGLMLSQRVTCPCECDFCGRGCGPHSPWHTDAEKATCVKGVVQVTDWMPANKSIERILAEYFEIDLNVLEAEKLAMLAALREANDVEYHGGNPTAVLRQAMARRTYP